MVQPAPPVLVLPRLGSGTTLSAHPDTSGAESVSPDRHRDRTASVSSRTRASDAWRHAAPTRVRHRLAAAGGRP
ncbi:hypothetical protein ACFPM0_05205 [Pseudonocardia sulfidoxydans]|uniref:hypothetical protein n=1 Tax=Pseudonocardia sulfidoxydans TaxID=54011 RepID=UPI003619A23E